MSFPFVSQVEPNGRDYRNCGPACLAMVLAYFGRGDATREAIHRLAEELRGRRWTIGAHTTLAQLSAVAARRGLTATRLTAWPAVDAALGAQIPIVLAVRSGPLAAGADAVTHPLGARHFIVLWSRASDHLIVADPAASTTARYSRTNVEAAAAALGRRLRAAAFGPTTVRR